MLSEILIIAFKLLFSRLPRIEIWSPVISCSYKWPGLLALSLSSYQSPSWPCLVWAAQHQVNSLFSITAKHILCINYDQQYVCLYVFSSRSLQNFIYLFLDREILKSYSNFLNPKKVIIFLKETDSINY